MGGPVINLIFWAGWSERIRKGGIHPQLIAERNNWWMKQDPTFKIVQNHFPPLYTEIGSSKARCKSTACEAADSRWHTRSSASSSAVSLRFLGHVGTHGRAKGWTWVCWTNVEHIPHIPYKIAVEYGKLATNNDFNLNDREPMGWSPWILMDSLVPYFHPNTHMGLHHFSRVYPRHGGGALFAWWISGISDGFQGFHSLLNILQDVFLQRPLKQCVFSILMFPGSRKMMVPNLDRCHIPQSKCLIDLSTLLQHHRSLFLVVLGDCWRLFCVTEYPLVNDYIAIENHHC